MKTTENSGCSLWLTSKRGLFFMPQLWNAVTNNEKSITEHVQKVYPLPLSCHSHNNQAWLPGLLILELNLWIP